MSAQYLKLSYGQYCYLNPILNGVYIQVEVSSFVTTFH